MLPSLPWPLGPGIDSIILDAREKQVWWREKIEKTNWQEIDIDTKEIVSSNIPTFYANLNFFDSVTYIILDHVFWILAYVPFIPLPITII